MRDTFCGRHRTAGIPTAYFGRRNMRSAVPVGCLYGLMILWMGTGCSGGTEESRYRSHTVAISAMQFQPATLTVQAGDTVVFMNRDIVTHDVTQKAGHSWEPVPLAPGDTWSMVVDKTIDYYCSLHPVMEGRIITE